MKSPFEISKKVKKVWSLRLAGVLGLLLAGYASRSSASAAVRVDGYRLALNEYLTVLKIKCKKKSHRWLAGGVQASPEGE
jgi:hypothetical protein